MIFEKDFLNGLLEQAAASPRLRVNCDLRNSAADTSQRMLLCPAEGCYGMQIPAGAWHTIRVLEPSVIFEAKDGAYKG